MRYGIALFVCLLASCGACSKGGSSVRGEVPYVRCMDVSAPKAREGTSGRVRFSIEGRVLRLESPTPLRIAAFRGAGEAPDASTLEPALRDVKAYAPSLVFVLGELGASEEDVTAHLRAFETLAVPVVVLAGGLDVAAALHDALDARFEHVIDGRGLRAVVVGEEVFVLVSGAPDGRYATGEGHCGASEDDLDALEDDVPRGRRWLVSWAAPSGGGPFAVGRGFGDVDGGSTRIEALARTLGAKGGIFAFPGTRALMPSSAEGDALVEPGHANEGLRVTVARVAGRAGLLYDGAYVRPAAALLELRPEGLVLVGTSVSIER